MSENLSGFHKKFAVDCFNEAWDLLDKANRTAEEESRMIHLAHASRFHWGEIGTPLEFARGDWQISRVYAVLGMGEASYRFAKTSLDHCLEQGIGDFDLAFAYEALARSCSILGIDDQYQQYRQKAVEAGNTIQETGNRDYFFSELNTIKP